jgi:hypothetical protein
MMEYFQATFIDSMSDGTDPLNPFFHLGGGVEMIGSLSFDPARAPLPQPITLTLQDAGGSITIVDPWGTFGYREGLHLIEISNYDFPNYPVIGTYDDPASTHPLT